MPKCIVRMSCVCACVHGSHESVSVENACLSVCWRGANVDVKPFFMTGQRYLRVSQTFPDPFCASNTCKDNRTAYTPSQSTAKTMIIITITISWSIPQPRLILYACVLQSLMLQTQMHQRLPRITPYRNPVPVPPTKDRLDPRFQEILVRNCEINSSCIDDTFRLITGLTQG